MSATNTDSPVLDGIWFRPYILTAAAANTGATTDSSSTGNSIPPTAKVAYVKAVTTNADDWITLPAVAGVPNGHEIIILAQASSNFELRTPTSSNTKINNVDSDATQEYLVTDTDVVRVIKVDNTVGWVAQSLTYLGAVRTAVTPD
jgi:hypothetical protein